MWNFIKYGWGVIGVLLAIWGIPTLGDNWPRWKAFAAWLAPYISPEVLRFTISMVGLVSLVILLIIEMRHRRRTLGTASLRPTFSQSLEPLPPPDEMFAALLNAGVREWMAWSIQVNP
jgi:hypothetical protein